MQLVDLPIGCLLEMVRKKFHIKGHFMQGWASGTFRELQPEHEPRIFASRAASPSREPEPRIFASPSFRLAEPRLATDYFMTFSCSFSYMKYFTASLWHPSGTCKMGNPTDPGAVVDAKLKVYGISKLRVADASIMPLVTSGNTQCPTYAIGEKAADMIKAEWAWKFPLIEIFVKCATF